MTSTEPTLTTESALEVLRRRPVTTELLGGFGPLVVAVALVLAMVLLAPSIAPERIVERPADGSAVEGSP